MSDRANQEGEAMKLKDRITEIILRKELTLTTTEDPGLATVGEAERLAIAIMNEIEPKTPPVITVRIKGNNHGTVYEYLLGQTICVVEDINSSLYQRIDKGGWISRSDAEPIPDIPKGYRLRRKWGKDEEAIGKGDLLVEVNSPETGWQATILKPGHRQARQGIYITPIKQVTPDPSPDCLPGYEAVEVANDGEILVYRTDGPDCDYAMTLNDVLSNPLWSGRYGYKREDERIMWTTEPRMAKAGSGNIFHISTLQTFGSLMEHKIILPDYVEMKKEGE